MLLSRHSEADKKWTSILNYAGRLSKAMVVVGYKVRGHLAIPDRLITNSLAAEEGERRVASFLSVR